ncbi:sulfatase-like hydrolase/transferase [Paenibacillus sp. HB172176]|uniref:sulfatase-like hydrolase/transferase n=1 Tax=Paenibacillus sp. HB172176 TaxID=2493690 RepID=UPI001439F7AC|nr:sulfatase-like hydrolase/transferase [Paenibacillus sp. HB172176]
MKNRPNILFITTDQQRWDCLGVARSNHPVMTPHLDQLAAEGLRFDKAYSDCPICIPARTTIMTGRCAYHHGQSNMTVKPFPEQDHLTLPGRLRDAGYQTHAVGKMHFHPPRARYGFDRMRLLPEDYVNWLETTPHAGEYRGHGLGGNEIYPVFASTPIPFTHSHWIVEESIDFIRQLDPHHPFFMWTSFEAPHAPFDPPESFVRLYDNADIPEPLSGDWEDEEAAPNWVKHTRWAGKFDELPAHVIRAARKHYYAQITHIDYELGRLFGELKSQGLYDNTLILFTSDHGEMLGDFNLFHKSAFYESSAHVPFLLKWHEQANHSWTKGQLADGAVQLADIYPTLLDAAGLWSAQDEESRDGVSLLQAQESDLQDRWICGYMNKLDGFYMATNRKWKYIYYVNGGMEQLFHLVNDPEERHNAAAEHPEALAICRRKLLEAIPELEDSQSETGLKRTTTPLPSKQEVKAVNGLAWRGPIRYGKGY